LITLRELNSGPAAEFVQSLAGIFEHSPWVAERAAASRPFSSRLALLDAMRAVVECAAPAEQLALIRAHPRLGVKGRAAVELTAASAREQRRAGLEACTPQDFVELSRLNDAYLDKFAMPFILAVRGHDPASIIANCERRLAHNADSEHRTALQQIGLIAGFRLADAVASPASVEVLAMLERLEKSADREALVREWMNAADLELSEDDTAYGSLIGLRRGDADATETLMLGVHVDPTTRALAYDGRLGFLLGIAIMQQLRQKDVWLEFDLAVLARPTDADLGDSRDLAEIDAQNVSVVALAGFGERTFATARRSTTARTDEQGPRWEASLVERAVFSLEDFLLHNEQMFDDHGTLARNG
jgi:OHCU decarboxylase